MECFKARPGHSLVQLDFAALEPTLLAEFSQDATLLNIYGPNALPNQDIYLYIAAKIPALGREIVKYYNPDAPTAEGLADAKKKCKRERGIAKTVHLASAYGAGAPKIHETLIEGGVDISLLEVKQIHADYWRLFAGVKRFESELINIHSATGGWIPNVLGRPICVDKGYLKDINNRMIQSSGHDCLQLFIANLAALRRTHNLSWTPWILDMHDECIVEVPNDEVEQTVQTFKEAMHRLNLELAMSISLKGDPMVAQTWADIKIEG
jgi:DNA polymerase I-like protein with 3'-5' exonuclease and polymerase domains